MKEKTILLTTSCIGCALRLVAFRDKNNPAWSSLYIYSLSNHSHLYLNSWRGRIRNAWRILRRGALPEDIGCESLDEATALHKAIGEMIRFIETGE